LLYSWGLDWYTFAGGFFVFFFLWWFFFSIELGLGAIGLLLFLSSFGVGFGILKLGEKIWKLKKSKEALAWELEDQLKELDEQMSLGHITQEEYEQRKKKLEESEA